MQMILAFSRRVYNLDHLHAKVLGESHVPEFLVVSDSVWKAIS